MKFILTLTTKAWEVVAVFILFSRKKMRRKFASFLPLASEHLAGGGGGKSILLGTWTREWWGTDNIRLL